MATQGEEIVLRSLADLQLLQPAAKPEPAPAEDPSPKINGHMNGHHATGDDEALHANDPVYEEGEDLDVEDEPMEEVPAIEEDPSDLRDDERFHQLMAFMVKPTDHDHAFFASLAPAELTHMLSIFQSAYGVSSAEEVDKSVADLVAALKNSPTHKARMAIVARKQADFIKLAQTVGRTFRHSSINDALLHDQYQRVLDQAIESSSLMAQIAVELARVLGMASPDESELSPQRFAMVMRAAAAHVRVGASAIATAEERKRQYADQLSALQGRVESAERDARIATLTVGQRISESHFVPQGLKRFIITNPSNQMLAVKGMKGEIPAKVSLSRVEWTSNYGHALRFRSQESALQFIDMLLMLEAGLLSIGKDTDESETDAVATATLRGIPVTDVAVASLGIIKEM